MSIRLWPYYLIMNQSKHTTTVFLTWFGCHFPVSIQLMSNTISVPLSLHMALIGVSKFDFFCSYPFDGFPDNCVSILGVRTRSCTAPWLRLQSAFWPSNNRIIVFWLLIAPLDDSFSANHFLLYISFYSFYYSYHHWIQSRDSQFHSSFIILIVSMFW